MADSWHSGRIASSGIAIGAAFPLPVAEMSVARQAAEVSTPAAEEGALRAAIAAAVADIGDLMATASGDASDILEFQIAMLEDDALSEPAFAEIAAGTTAEAAWQAALTAQIADYAASDDDYFRARMADLADMQDRVLRHLRGEAAIIVPPGAVLLGDDLTPSLFLSQDWSQGGAIALSKGSSSSHVAMLARMRQVPMVVGLNIDLQRIAPGTLIIVDAEDGRIAIAPDTGLRQVTEQRRQRLATELALAETYRLRPGRTADGEPAG